MRHGILSGFARFWEERIARTALARHRPRQITRRITQLYLAAAAVGLLAAGQAAWAAEPNNDPLSATEVPLAPGSNQVEISDGLNGADGRLDTLLGHFDASYASALASDDDGSPLGNGQASALFGLPLEPNGAVYVSVTGAGDEGFVGNHALMGAYRIIFDIYDASGNLLESTDCPDSFGGAASGCVDSLAPNGLDNFWLNPDPARAGGSVDVVIDNVLGAGDGDALDFWRFTGLPAGTPFVLEVIASEFDPLLGLFDSDNPAAGPIDTDGGPAVLPRLEGSVPDDGQLLAGVTGLADTGFVGEHIQVGAYTLRVTVVPEPAAGVLLAMGLAAVLWLRHPAAVRRLSSRRSSCPAT